MHRLVAFAHDMAAVVPTEELRTRESTARARNGVVMRNAVKVSGSMVLSRQQQRTIQPTMLAYHRPRQRMSEVHVFNLLISASGWEPNRDTMPAGQFFDHLEAANPPTEIERNKTARFNPTQSHSPEGTSFK